MSNPETGNQESVNRQLIDAPKYPKTYSVPAAIHEAMDTLVYGANHASAKTTKSEMVAVLVHHAFTSMGDEELSAAWWSYRKAEEASLRERSSSFPE